MTEPARITAVVCDRHGPVARPVAYVVCVHILQQPSAVIAHFQNATAEEIGRVLCFDCFQQFHHMEHLKMMCGQCVHELIAEREFR